MPLLIRATVETERGGSFMGMLEGLKQTLNIAGSKIIVVTADQIYSQFDLIRGEVLVRAALLHE